MALIDLEELDEEQLAALREIAAELGVRPESVTLAQLKRCYKMIERRVALLEKFLRRHTH
jgi:Mn-dependent DtxR family transcriptional regulator